MSHGRDSLPSASASKDFCLPRSERRRSRCAGPGISRIASVGLCTASCHLLHLKCLLCPSLRQGRPGPERCLLLFRFETVQARQFRLPIRRRPNFCHSHANWTGLANSGSSCENWKQKPSEWPLLTTHPNLVINDNDVLWRRKRPQQLGLLKQHPFHVRQTSSF